MKNRLKATRILTRTLSVINFINMPHHCRDDSRLASFVSSAAMKTRLCRRRVALSRGIYTLSIFFFIGVLASQIHQYTTENDTVRTMALCVKRPLRWRVSQRPFQHNACHIMRTNINQGRIQSLAVHDCSAH